MKTRFSLKRDSLTHRRCFFASVFLVLLGTSLTANAQSDPSKDASETTYRQVVITEFGGPDVLAVVKKTGLP